MIELDVLGDNIKEVMIDAIKTQIGLRFNRKYYTTDGEVYILIGESYAFRVDSDLTSTVILEFINDSEAKCTIMATGGAHGLCRFDWGAQGSNERTIANTIRRLADDNGWAVKTISKT
ncbi:MAG: hypothetical protein ACFFFG_00645 [Candidatus Thorarchaeota archaeon]